jgi:hypothetical protein
MKNFDLNSMGVQELNTSEMQKTDGGVFWFVVIAAAVFLTSCTGNNVTFQIGGSHNEVNQGASADSTLNGTRFDVPIGY